eukprot:366387-Chlamydomonas_euryale.AAC.11
MRGGCRAAGASRVTRWGEKGGIDEGRMQGSRCLKSDESRGEGGGGKTGRNKSSWRGRRTAGASQNGAGPHPCASRTTQPMPVTYWSATWLPVPIAGCGSVNQRPRGCGSMHVPRS